MEIDHSESCRQIAGLAQYQRFQSSFLSHLIEENKNTLSKIYKHSFNENLIEGTLSQDIFGHYLRQDNYYLKHLPLVLQRLSAKTAKSDSKLNVLLNHMATEIIGSELTMHHDYQHHFDRRYSFSISPVILQYIEFLLEVSSQKELLVGLAAILPCFHIYKTIGENYVSATNPYHLWLQTYTDPEFILTTHQLSETLNIEGELAYPELQNQIKNAFALSVQFELNFFDAIYAGGST